MSPPHFNNWQAIQAEVLRRIHAREWHPGQTIPGEVELASEFGCARATVNRALQALADAGLLERRRKAGTRVALNPVSKATVDIPVIRQEVEDRGLDYAYRLVSRDAAAPPLALRAVIGEAGLHVTALHLAGGAAHVFEDRWISLATVPSALTAPFSDISANEWLLRNAPFTQGDIAFTAAAAGAREAAHLETDPGAPLFVIERTTWDRDRAITFVRLSYAPGYRIHSVIGGASSN